MRHYIFIILLQVCCYSCAQQKISINQLIGTKWTIESPQNVKRTVEFHEEYYTKNIQILLGEEMDTSKLDYEYYLTNKEPSVFDKHKGKQKKGIYLVVRNGYNKEPLYHLMWYYTIMSYSPQKMVLFKKAEELKEGQIVIGTPPRDVILTLERIYE
jgi:hypothetical protein